jgi:uncharacterized metal-binding protein YceD (DUF177 family)
MKLVGLMLCRNSDWVIGLSLRAALMWCDAVVVLMHNCSDDTEEIVVLKRSETEINVATLIYEFINLAVPYISRCEDEGNAEWCDREMIAKLEQLAPGPKEEIEDADPRWEALKNIKK